MPFIDRPWLSAADLLDVQTPHKSTELVRGQLVVREPPSTRHGEVSATLAYLILHHARQNGAGAVYGQDTGFQLASDPDTVRAADVAFVRRERVDLVPEFGYARLAPDLVAEIASPEDRKGELLSKAGEWLDAGTRLVWVIDPTRRDGQVYRADGSVAIVGGDGALEGEAVLPGFRCTLTELLAR